MCCGGGGGGGRGDDGSSGRGGGGGGGIVLQCINDATTISEHVQVRQCVAASHLRRCFGLLSLLAQAAACTACRAENWRIIASAIEAQ